MFSRALITNAFKEICLQVRRLKVCPSVSNSLKRIIFFSLDPSEIPSRYFDCLKFHAYFQPPPPKMWNLKCELKMHFSVNVTKRRKQRSLLRSPEDMIAITKIFNVALLNWQKWACANYYVPQFTGPFRECMCEMSIKVSCCE